MHKRIEYDRVTRDYAYYLDDQLIGYAKTYRQAEQALNEHVYSLLIHGPVRCELCEKQASHDYRSALVCQEHYDALLLSEQEELKLAA